MKISQMVLLTTLFSFYLLVSSVSGWAVTDTNRSVCVLVEGNVTFTIRYNKNDGSVAENTVLIPVDNTTTTGKCGNSTTTNSELTVQWSGGNYKFYFLFHKDIKTDLWYTQIVELTYNESSASFVDCKEPNPSKKARTTDQLFSTRLTHSYQCNAIKSYDMYRVFNDNTMSKENTVTFSTAQLLVKPFQNMEVSEHCSSDDKKPTEAPAPAPKPKTDPPAPKPKTDPPKPHTDKPNPQPEPQFNGVTGRKVGWTVTVLSVLGLSCAGILIYVNRGETPNYLRVI